MKKFKLEIRFVLQIVLLTALSLLMAFLMT